MKPVLQDIKIGPEFIGHALRDKILYVPPNQREYSWKEKHVKDLLSDLENIIDAGGQEYFLGSIVVTDDPNDRPRVVDGQQRLATTLILIAAIRDYLDKVAPTEARKLELLYIFSPVLGGEDQPHLNLNDKDRDFFRTRILLPPTDPARIAIEKVPPVPSSHVRISDAGRMARDHVRKLTKNNSVDVAQKKLLRWVTFLEKGAVVIWVEVPNDSAAYMVFETMNDRGLELSATDLVKNHLFFRAGQAALENAQRQWAGMVGALEVVQEADIVKNFVRHYWIAKHGPVRTQELFNEIKDATPNKTAGMKELSLLCSGSTLYAALLNPMSGVWTGYSERSRKNLMTLGYLGIKQIRPLLLAVVENFTKREVEKVLRLAVSWSVRLLASGEVGGGATESSYGANALEVTKGGIKNAKDLALAVARVVPADDDFENVFATSQVTKSVLARYYLRCLEMQQAGSPEPENIPNDDLVINLEHVLPENPSPNTWTQFSAEDRQLFTERIGNLALMKFSDNSDLENTGFAEKKAQYKKSTFKLTSQLATVAEWNTQEIIKRQKRLAALAVKAWPLKY